jgi:hypothetical protein
MSSSHTCTKHRSVVIRVPPKGMESLAGAHFIASEESG